MPRDTLIMSLHVIMGGQQSRQKASSILIHSYNQQFCLVSNTVSNLIGTPAIVLETPEAAGWAVF